MILPLVFYDKLTSLGLGDKKIIGSTVNTRGLDKRKKDNPQLNCLFGSNVGMTGLLRDPEWGKLLKTLSILKKK